MYDSWNIFAFHTRGLDPGNGILVAPIRELQELKKGERGGRGRETIIAAQRDWLVNDNHGSGASYGLQFSWED